MVNSGDGPLVAALRKDPSIGHRAIEMISRPGTFKADEDEAKAFFLIFSQMFSDDAEVRSEARDFLSKGQRPPVVFINRKEVVDKLSQDGEFHKWMVNELAKGNTCSLEAWSVTIRLSGAIIHMSGSGTIILNSLLQVVEKGFKHADNEIRKASYKAWIVLMDNFAEDPSILCSSKRIRLITRPLVGAISHRTEEQIRTKFETWWHYIGLFKENLASNVEHVVLPFLQFCYKNVGIGTSVTQSPAKKFVSLRSLCLEAMAVLVSGLNNVKASQINIVTMMECLKDGAGVIKAAGFAKEHQILLACVSEAFSFMRFNSRSEVSHMTAICQTLGSIAKDLCMAQSEVNKEAVTNFLQTSLNMLVTLERQMTQEDPSSAVSLALTILDTVSKLPTSALVSRKLLPPQTNPLSMIMIQTMLRPNLTTLSSSQSEGDRNKYNVIFERFVAPYGQQRMDGLYILHDVLNILSGCKSLKENQMMTLWKNVAGYFEQHLLKFGSVNQSKNNLEVDLSASQCILLFPFLQFASVVSKQAWSQWTTLYKQIVEKAETTPLYQNLFIENVLASEVASKLPGKQVTVDEYSNLCRNLCESIVPALKVQIQSQATQQSSQGNENDLGKAKAVIELLAYLASLAPELLKDKAQTISLALSCRSLCRQMGTVLDMGSAKGVLQELFEILSPGMATLLDNKLLSSLGTDYQFQAEGLFDKAVNVLQARYDGHFTLEFLKPVQPFIVCTLSHPKSKIANKARGMWEITWAKKLTGKKIPPEIANCLKSTSFTDSSSSQDSQSLPTVSTPTSFRSSFLDRAKNEAVAAATSPKFARPAQLPSSAKKPAKPLFSLEEENSSDFVKISPASKKRRPLTEHQKEKLTTRSDDIPALYSEVSRDASGLEKLPPQFDSQLSMDESSMMAMDATDVQMSKQTLPSSDSEKAPDTKENEETTLMGSSHEAKRKQLHPNKVVAPPKKRGRKRKIEETETSITATHTPDSEPKREKGKRGRPPLRRPTIAVVAATSAESGPEGRPLAEKVADDISGIDKTKSDVDPSSPHKSSVIESSGIAAPSKINSQLINAPLVNIDRMNVQYSPIKIVQMDPLVYEPTVGSISTNSVARKIKFPSDNSAVLTNGHDEKMGSADEHEEEDDDVIGSSQSSSSGPESKRLKRKRKTKSLDGTEKPLLTKRPSSRRSALLLQATSLISGENPTSGNSTTGLSGKENSAPQSGKSVDNLVRNKHGETELHTAAKKKNMERVKELIDSGFDVNTRDYFGWTPLHESINDDPNSFAILKILIENGADVNAKAKDGTTPLHDAMRFLSQELVDYLVEHGADPSIPNEDGKSVIDLYPERFGRNKVSVPESEDMLTSQSEPEVTDEIVKETDVVAAPQDQEQPSEMEVDQAKPTEIPVDEGMTPDSKEESNSNAEEDKTEAAASEVATASATNSSRTLIKPPLPFSPQMSRPASVLSKVASRGLRLFEMSRAKSTSVDGGSPVVTSPSVVLMSPKPEADTRTTGPNENDLMTTPTQPSKPWQKYAPSPMDASPSAGILKRTGSEKSLLDPCEDPVPAPDQPPCKIRRVQFKDPPVSDQVEIPRCPSGKGTRQRLNDSKLSLMFLPKTKINFAQAASQSSESGATAAAQKPASTESADSNSSIGSYESTPLLSSEELGPNPNCLYPSLVNCDVPLITIIQNLANRPWVSAAEKSFAEHGITKISDLSRLTKVKARSFDKFLKAPDSVTTIREALRKFEKTWNKKDKEKLQAVTIPAVTATTAASTAATDEATVVAASEKVDNNDVVNVAEQLNKKTGIASIVEESTPEEEDETMREIYDRPSPSPTEEITKSVVNPSTTSAESEDHVRAPSPPTIVDEPFVAVDADLPAPKPSTAEKVAEEEIPSSESVVVVEDEIMSTQNDVVKDIALTQVGDVENDVLSTQNEDVVMTSTEDHVVSSTEEKASQSDVVTNEDDILRKAVEILKRRSTIDVFTFMEQIIQMAKNKE